jgi:tetratricopeptide (TPR) repeat protein
VILDMLARGIGEDNFPKVLKQIVKATANRPISTDRFIDLIERITSVQLDSFASQFVYGTGLPEVYYTYQVKPKDGGKWTIQGEARQQTPYRFRYRVVKNGSAFDVQREKLDQIQVQGSTLIVPFQADIYDPGRDKEARKKSEASNAILRGTMILTGEKTPFALDVDYKPSRFTLDRDQAVFGIFYNESEQPKRMLYYRGLDATAAGQVAEAEALYKQALAAPVEVSASADNASRDEKIDRKRSGRVFDARAELGLARLYLEQGKDAQAQESLDRAEKVLGNYEGWVGEELRLIQSRLEMRRGVYDKAFRRLRKGVLGSGSLDSTEAYVLLAIAAQATGNQKEMEEAVKTARENGADVTALVGG